VRRPTGAEYSMLKASTAVPWNDSVGVGGWDQTDWSLGTAGSGIFIPSLSGSPVANTIYGNNIPKCWGLISFNATSTPTPQDTFNVASVTADSIGGFTVNFIVPMATNTYHVQLSADSAGANISAGPGVDTNSCYPFIPIVVNKTTTSMTIQVCWWDPGAQRFKVVRLDTGSTVNGTGIVDNGVHFTVFARQ